MNKLSRSKAAPRILALAALATLLAACSKDESQTASAPAAGPEQGAPAAAAPDGSPEDQRMANAVVTAKTAAAVDLKYDVLSKPDVGKPFEIELAFMPRLPADVLEVEVTGIEGFAIVSGGAIRFEPVMAGDRYLAKVLAQADAPGIYYANVMARMITEVQTEVRTFSVPVVVGSVPPVQKVAPEQDASGAPVQSMPAVESGGPAESKPN